MDSDSDSDRDFDFELGMNSLSLDAATSANNTSTVRKDRHTRRRQKPENSGRGFIRGGQRPFGRRGRGGRRGGRWDGSAHSIEERDGVFEERRSSDTTMTNRRGNSSVPCLAGRRGARQGRGKGRGGRTGEAVEIDDVSEERKSSVTMGATGGVVRARRGNTSVNRFSGDQRKSPRAAYMGYKRLQELTLSGMDDRALCLTLISERSGFSQLIEEEHIKPDWMKFLLELISKACKCSVREYVLPLLNKVAQSHFLDYHLAVKYIIKISHERNRTVQQGFARSIGHIFDILEAVLTKLPSFSDKCETVLLILETIPQKLDHLSEDEISLLEININALKERINDTFARGRKEIRHTEVKEPLERRDPENFFEDEPPPDDFRQLSICPTVQDILTDTVPYVRANKEHGGYDDVGHYLDIQFRLLREDYVRPLREGIAEYLANVAVGQPKTKLSDMRLYHGVQIICPMCTRDGIVYRIQFDNSGLGRVRWQASKRLIYGSLVCLSSDNFQTMLFATVNRREIERIAEGFLDIQFVGHFDLQNDGQKAFVMAETSAYFEAYRHVLAGLQEMTDEVPFQRYIVSCLPDVRPPQYLRRAAPLPYDLSFCVKEGVSRLNKEIAKKVPVLTTSRWPTTDTFCFDDSQLKAVKTALTKEFAIIQGPPGTGKTYVGLKIVKALLVNKAAWGVEKPILIVCYTNHALDQFLEGMLDFEIDGLIRVGGRSISKRLDKFTIKSKKDELRRRKQRRREILDGNRDCFAQMNELQERIEDTSVKLEVSARGILNEKALQCHMTEEQFDSFSTQMQYTNGRKATAMPLWLNITVGMQEALEGFGESVLFALTPDHIATLLFRLKAGDKGDTRTIVFLERYHRELESRLLQDNDNGFQTELDGRWIQYHEYQNRFYTKQVFGLKHIKKKINHLEQRISSQPARSKNKRKETQDLDTLLNELDTLQQDEAEVKSNMVMLEERPGILRASVLVQVLQSEERRHLDLNSETCDDFFFPRWLGFGEVVDLLNSAMLDADDEDEVTDDDTYLVDAEEDAEVLMNQRELEYQDADKDLNPARDERREYVRRMALEELSVCLEKVLDVPCKTDWQTKMPSKRRQKQQIKQIVQGVDKMTPVEAANVQNVWHLNSRDRCRLYAYWLAMYREDLKWSIQVLTTQYNDLARRLKHIREEEDYDIMNNATVIGMTTTGAAKFRHVLQRIKPPIIVVEEAAEVLESHVISALNPECEHLILIGDHKQLRPSPAVYQLAKKFNLELSLFERMVNNNVRCDTLELQHRMRPEISEIMRFIYPNLKNHDSVIDLEDIKGVSCNFFFIDHQFAEVKHEENKSRSNIHEALFLAAFCRYLLLQGYEPSQITVLTTYSGQVFELKKVMPKKTFGGVRVTAVDNYQGEENDIILLSLVRSQSRSIGFLNVDNRVCVALSRARKGLFVIGNFNFLSRKSTLWAKMVNMMKANDRCGKSLELYCQNHPNLERIQATTANDFAGAPEGGCMRPCESRLKCGHQCPKPCHNLDRNHDEYICQKPCTKECEFGHRCKKLCYKDCGDCRERVKKILPECGHEHFVPCHQDPSTFSCRHRCSLILPCGHQCAENCGDAHTKICNGKILRTWPCGHVVKIACHNKTTDFPCPQMCETVLACGHSCKGTCSGCLQGRLHQGCTQKCGRTLVCGHECREACTKTCPPCTIPCENRCTHSRCDKACGEACVICREPCQWSCRHYKCSNLCGEICDRPPCDEPCRETLSCGHPCIGLCGEECPPLCRICNKDQVCEMLFGTEDEDDVRFILLEDCGHVVEVSGMDQWMAVSSSEESGKSDVQLKVCPKCKVAVRKSLRYGKYVKNQLNDIEEVKKKIRGRPQEVSALVTELRTKLRKVDLFDKLTHNILDCRLSKPDLSLHKLNVLRNQIEFLKSGNHLIRQTIKENKKGHIDDDVVEEVMQSIKQVHTRILNWCNYVSEQQLQEAKFELLRLSYLFKLRMYRNKLRGKADVPYITTCTVKKALATLKSNNPFNSDKETEMSKLVDKLNKLIPLGISNEERNMVVRAMALTQGHWFKCPNGHVYAIGDCGGAMEESTCPECHATIGGGQHKLRADNKLASEMDGAKYAAWSDQANMANYVFDD